MKNKNLTFLLIIIPLVSILIFKSFSETKKTPKPEKIVELMGTQTTFGVKGNCGMCKKTIENAASSVSGVIKVDWNKNTKQVNLVYDSQIADLMSVHRAIAKSGYDTEIVKHDPDSYENLPLCCQYDPEMIINSN
tara:strand:- start:78 stop:482 length:405 start_codon:yes stop_codon:yes gene_type:complete